MQQPQPSSTTQVNDHIHTYAPAHGNGDYPDLALNLMSLSDKPSQGSGIGKDYWLDDASATKCRSCEHQFTTFRRKHHCRICGKIFCGACTTFIDGAKFNVQGRMRVCLPCAQLADRYEDYNTSEDESVIDDTASSVFRIGDTSTKAIRSRDLKEQISRDALSRDSESRHSMVHPATSNDHMNHSIAGSNMTPVPPPMLTIPTTRKGESVEIDVPHVKSKHSGSLTASALTGGNMLTTSVSTPANIDTNSLAATPSNDKPLAPLSFTAVAANAASSIFNFTSQAASSRSNLGGISATTSLNSPTPRLQPTSSAKGISPTPRPLNKSHAMSEDNLLEDTSYIQDVYSNPSDSSDDDSHEYRGLTWTQAQQRPVSGIANRSLRRSRNRRASTFYRLRHRHVSKTAGGRVVSNASGAAPSFTFGSEDFEFMDDFLRAGERHGRLLLQELLTDKEASNVPEWTSSLMKCLKKISTVSIEVNSGAGFDLSNYLKLKRIPGGSITDTCVVDGVVFSKSLPLKSMPRSIENPRIMLITFPIEYEQGATVSSGPQFSSLEPIIQQQNEFLRKLVGRIETLHPSLVLTTSSVNGYALKLFSDAGLAVATEVKPQVLERVSRMTNADIIGSIDKFALKPKLGHCSQFEVKTYLHEHIMRTYFFLTGCDSSLGFTTVLRGSDKDGLGKVKECAALMAYVFFNVKLESALMRDQCLQAPVYKEAQLTDALYKLQINGYDDIWPLVGHRVLSSSPWVSLHAPHLLSELRQLISRRNANDRIFQEYSKEYSDLLTKDKADRDARLQRYLDFWKIAQVADDLPNGYEDLSNLIQKSYHVCSDSLGYEVQLAVRQWDQFWSTRAVANFDPNYHQNIATMFSMVSSKNATPCIGPVIQLTDFYWENDFSLGQYIEHICQHAEDMCPEGCGLTLQEHYRTYVHGSGKVDVVFETVPPPLGGKEDMIMSWSFCKTCNNTTAVLPLSDNAWKYSFGKYLELSFWCRNMKVKGANCDHDFYQDHIHYFSYHGHTLRIEYSDIDALQLVPPRFQIFWSPRYEVKIKLSTYELVLRKSREFFDSVRGRLNRVKVDSMTTDKMESGQQRISELKERVEKEQDDVEMLCKHIYNSTDVTDHLDLNAVIREVQELSSDWNTEFSQFAKDYLPSEKDIRKITSLQLDKLFGMPDEKAEKKLDKPETSEKVEESLVEDQVVNEDAEAAVEEDASPKPIPRNNSGLLSKKNFWENQGSDMAKSESDSLALALNSGKVKKLAEYFDAQDYFKQRDLEKRKIDKAYSYMPKVGSSKPKVEVYKDAKDAVVDEKKQPDEEPVEETKEKEPDKETEREQEKEVQPEKVSILKSLTRFWEDRSASLWEPLKYPLDITEHIFVDSDVIVREDEPSSIVAFCLSTSDYVSKLCDGLKPPGGQASPVPGAPAASQTAHNSVGSLSGVSDTAPLGGVDTPVGSRSVSQSSKKAEESTDTVVDDTAEKPVETLESIMLKKGFHLKYQFEEGYSTISCKIFFAEQFEALRRQCGVEDNFVQSLSRCVKWSSGGGKSGSTFLKTLDDRFIIKELSKIELEAFVQLAPNYFEYFAQALFHNLPTVLVKFFGFYQIQVKNSLSSGRSYTIDILVTENMFYDRKMSRIFDLKGSMRNRHVEQTGKENEVLLDENMVEYIYESPLFVHENAKRLLRASLWNDTLFLAKMNVMDYSLVVGIDSENNELVVGIIDCIRPFTWDKKLESWVKERGLVGGTGVGKEPTVITPKQYKNRFREAMERYILMVPGAFYQGTT